MGHVCPADDCCTPQERRAEQEPAKKRTNPAMKYVMTVYVMEYRRNGEWYPDLDIVADKRKHVLDAIERTIENNMFVNRRNLRVGVYECVRLSKP